MPTKDFYSQYSHPMALYSIWYLNVCYAQVALLWYEIDNDNAFGLILSVVCICDCYTTIWSWQHVRNGINFIRNTFIITESYPLRPMRVMRLKSPITRLFVQQLVQGNINTDSFVRRIRRSILFTENQECVAGIVSMKGSAWLVYAVFSVGLFIGGGKSLCSRLNY